MQKLSFTTLSCPEWDLKTIIQHSKEYGFNAIDIQGIQDQIEISQIPEFTSKIKNTKALLEDADISISCISSSAFFLLKTLPEYELHIDEVKRCLEIAAQLDAPAVRILDGRLIRHVDFDEQIKYAAELYQPVLENAYKQGITIAIETHEGLVQSAKMRQAIELVNHPALKIVWDLNHSFRKTNESPETTAGILTPYISCVHIKDSIVTLRGDVKPVLTGTGTNPIPECIQALNDVGYNGYFTFEWEKNLFPDIEEPEVALPHFVKKMKKWMK